MVRTLARRVLRAVLTLWGVVTVVFVLSRLSGSPARLLLPPDATAADVAQLESSMGLDRPLPVQYVTFLGDAAAGDLGRSTTVGGPALQLVLSRLPATVELALVGFVLGAVLGLGAALLVQLTGSRWLRAGLLWVGTLRQALPTFLFGVLLVLVFAIGLRWLPALGYGGLGHLVLPAVTLATFEFALYLRLLDSGFGEQAGQEYVRTAWAKGRGRFGVVTGHMLPNALLPVLTIAGLQLGAMLGGSAVIETVFNWPGVGQLMIRSVAARDYPVVQAGFLVICLLFVLVNLAVDVVSAVVDPRVRAA